MVVDCSCMLQNILCRIEIQDRRISFAGSFDHFGERGCIGQSLQYQQVASVDFDIELVAIIVESALWNCVHIGRLNANASSGKRMGGRGAKCDALASSKFWAREWCHWVGNKVCCRTRFRARKSRILDEYTILTFEGRQMLFVAIRAVVQAIFSLKSLHLFC